MSSCRAFWPDIQTELLFISRKLIKWPLISQLFAVLEFIPWTSTMTKVCRTNKNQNVSGVSASHFLTASLFLNIAFLHLLSNTSCLSFLTPPITTVDTSPHRFMSLKHQPAESYNSSSASHYSSCSFACYTDLGKLVGQRSLKLHKAALFLSLQFNQNRHSSNANPQLNFLQAKCWGIKKKKKEAWSWQAFMTSSSSVAKILHLHHY